MVVKEISQIGVTWGLITIFCTESWLISYILRIQWVPPWHPWAKLIIQDGVQDGCQNIISIMFQKISASNNPRHMIFRSKHNVIGVESSIDDGASKIQNGRHNKDDCRYCYWKLLFTISTPFTGKNEWIFSVFRVLWLLIPFSYFLNPIRRVLVNIAASRGVPVYCLAFAGTR